MSEELKPCPMCGGKAEIIDAMNEVWAHCLDDRCMVTGPARSYSGSAVRAWNHRAPLVVTDEMISRALSSKARDDEGEFPCLLDLLNFSGENKSVTVVRAALTAALKAVQ